MTKDRTFCFIHVNELTFKAATCVVLVDSSALGQGWACTSYSGAAAQPRTLCHANSATLLRLHGWAFSTHQRALGPNSKQGPSLLTVGGWASLLVCTAWRGLHCWPGQPRPVGHAC